MLLLILGNALYINRMGFALTERLDRLPDIGTPGCAEGVRDLTDFWQERVGFVLLSVSYPIADRITEQAATLLACAECGDVYGYRTALAMLYDAVEDMQRLERVFG